MKKLFFLFVLLCPYMLITAQDNSSWQRYFDRTGTLDDAENEDWQTDYDLLSDLADEKINLNTATQADLEQLPFLSEQQVEDIEEYLYHYAPVRSLGELALIESIDADTYQLLTHFVYAGEAPKKKAMTLGDMLRRGKNELTAAARIPFYTREGDRKGYLGPRYKHWFRYTFHYGQRLKAGLVGSQDAGEPFFKGRNSWGYDYYSFYVALHDWGRLKSLAVGRYRMRTGLGLVLNNDYSFGKLSMLQALGRSQTAIRPHSSRSEANYMQGAAATFSVVKGLEATAFVSWRHIDGTLAADSMSIATLLRTGYHRTRSEMARKHNASQTALGGNVRFASGGFHVGGTMVYTSFSRELKPNTNQKYRRYYPDGKSFWNLSLDYGYTSRRLTVGGETATGDCGAVATLNSVAYSPTAELQLTGVQRYYSYRFYSLLGRSFSEGGRVQNESGVLLGLNWRPRREWQVMAYADYAYFAWPRYRADDHSHAWDFLAQGDYEKGNTRIFARYRLRVRQYNSSVVAGLSQKTEHRFRVGLDHTMGSWRSHTQVDMATARQEENSFGWMLSQSLGYTWRWLQAYGFVGWFDTDDYDSRLYTYERSTLYTFSFPVYFGNGLRYSLLLRADVSPSLMLMAKVGVTDYFDRDHIGSSLQTIDRSSQTDMEVQLRWKF